MSTFTPTTTTTATEPARVLVMAASARAASLNRALGRRIASALGAAGDDVGVIELADYALPLYDDETEQRIGVPDAARDLADRFATAEVLVVVSPEFNGTFTPLLKNTIDWVTRVDISALAHLTVLVAAASPGAGGGANGAVMVRTWFKNMGIVVAARPMIVRSARLTDDGDIADVDDHDVEHFVAQVLPARNAA